MKVFHYWLDVALNTPFHATYQVVKRQTLTQHTDPLFNECVEAIKKAGCSWEMHEVSDSLIETCPQPGVAGSKAA